MATCRIGFNMREGQTVRLIHESRYNYDYIDYNENYEIEQRSGNEVLLIGSDENGDEAEVWIDVADLEIVWAVRDRNVKDPKLPSWF